MFYPILSKIEFNRQVVFIYFLQFPLQYGVLADIYSLTILLFELFSGIDPFPGSMGQIWQAKNLDEKPEFPLEFPAALKNLISVGWSKKPRERPAIEKIKIALNVLKQEEETTHMGKVP